MDAQMITAPTAGVNFRTPSISYPKEAIFSVGDGYERNHILRESLCRAEPVRIEDLLPEYGASPVYDSLVRDAVERTLSRWNIAESTELIAAAIRSAYYSPALLTALIDLATHCSLQAVDEPQAERMLKARVGDDRVSAALLRYIARMGFQTLLPALHHLLISSEGFSDSRRLAILEAIGAFENSRSRPALEQFLDHLGHEQQTTFTPVLKEYTRLILGKLEGSPLVPGRIHPTVRNLLPGSQLPTPVLPADRHPMITVVLSDPQFPYPGIVETLQDGHLAVHLPWPDMALLTPIERLANEVALSFRIEHTLQLMGARPRQFMLSTGDPGSRAAERAAHHFAAGVELYIAPMDEKQKSAVGGHSGLEIDRQKADFSAQQAYIDGLLVARANQIVGLSLIPVLAD